ncbi:DeoR family transcriptional regulator, partial [Enterobacter cloacae]
LAADHTKYTASAAVEIGNVAQATALFTDELPGSALHNHLKFSKVEVVEVSTGDEQQAG